METEQKPKKEKRLPIRIIGQEGPTVLVEYRERNALKRAYVPTEAIEDGACSEEALALGIPYGDDLGQYISRLPTPKAIAEELKRAGIWTRADLTANLLGAKRIFASFCGRAFSEFLREIKGGKRG